MNFSNQIKTEVELRSLIGEPSELVRKKVMTKLDKNCIEFISKSPFLVMATTDDSGCCDASPRGDMPGFIYVLNEKQLVIPERPGNRRIDSMKNILLNPKVGLLFFIPGLGETLRVNGKAVLLKDEALLEEMEVRGKKPLVAIGVEVEECFIHCAKAFKRSGLWDWESWEQKDSLPSAAKIIYEHANLLDTSVESIQQQLNEAYEKRLY